MSRLSLLLVLLVVLTAGCNGISSGSSAPDRDPYGVDDSLESSLSEPGENVAGLTEEGFQNDTFVRDHHAVLENRSYATIQTTTATLPNGTILLENEQSTRVDATSRASLTRSQLTGSWTLDVRERDNQQRIVQYRADEHDRLVRIEHENGTVEYERAYISRSGGLYDFLRPLRDATEVEIERETYADGKYTVVEGTEPVSVSMYLDDEPFTVRAYIRDDGLVRYITLDATIRQGGERIRIDRKYLIENIGEVSVERPDWYEKAEEELEGDDVTVSEAIVEE